MTIFDYLCAHREKYHTRMLYWMLDPEGDCNAASKFMSKFLKKIEVEETKLDESWEVSKEEEREEEEGLKGEPDIQLESESYLIYVENKTKMASVDHEQLERYCRLGREQSSEKQQFLMVFITPRGVDAVTQKVIKNQDIRHVRWIDIVEILGELINDDEIDEFTRGLLAEYKKYVEVTVLHKFEKFRASTEEIIKKKEEFLEAKHKTVEDCRGFIELLKEEMDEKIKLDEEICNDITLGEIEGSEIHYCFKNDSEKSFVFSMRCNYLVVCGEKEWVFLRTRNKEYRKRFLDMISKDKKEIKKRLEETPSWRAIVPNLKYPEYPVCDCPRPKYDLSDHKKACGEITDRLALYFKVLKPYVQNFFGI